LTKCVTKATLSLYISTKIIGGPLSNRVNARLLKKHSKMETIKFYGDEYLIPSPIEDFLVYCYGDWEIKRNKKRRL